MMMMNDDDRPGFGWYIVMNKKNDTECGRPERPKESICVDE